MPQVSPAQLDALFARLKANHVLALTAYKDKLAGIPVVSTAAGPTLSAKQVALIEHFRKWDYGCQRTEVRELVELLADLPVGTLKTVGPRQSSRNNGLRISAVFNGMFVKFKKKNGWDIDIAIGDPCLALADKYVSSEVRGVSTSYGFTVDKLEDASEIMEVLTDTEIDNLLAAWRAAASVSTAVQTRLAKLFEL